MNGISPKIDILMSVGINTILIPKVTKMISIKIWVLLNLSMTKPTPKLPTNPPIPQVVKKSVM